MIFLALCEESQAVSIAFRTLGFVCYSVDLLPSSGNHPEWHIIADALKVAKGGWFLTQAGNLVFIPANAIKISFPPCTELTVSGARWFEKKRLSGEQEQSIRFFYEIWKVSNAVENPIGILNGGKISKTLVSCFI